MVALHCNIQDNAVHADMTMQTVLLIGCTGLLGRQMYRDLVQHPEQYSVYGIAHQRGTAVTDGGRNSTASAHTSPTRVLRCDISDSKTVKRYISDVRPDVIIYCAMYRHTDGTLSTAVVADNMKRVNVDAATVIFQYAQLKHIFVVYISCDSVFDGKQSASAAYRPTDQTAPINAVGISKVAAEQQLWASQCRGCVLRLSTLYGGVEQLNESTVTSIGNDVLAAAEGKTVQLDRVNLLHPLHVADASHCIQSLLQTIQHNVSSVQNQTFHFGGQESYTRLSIGKMLCSMYELPVEDKLQASNGTDDTSTHITQPYNTRLDNTATIQLLQLDTYQFTPLIDGLQSATAAYMPTLSHDDASQQLDLPLRLCLMILKSTAPDLQQRYYEYVRTKQRRNAKISRQSSVSDAPLTFNQFLFTSTIRNYGDNFVYDKPELAYYMITDSSDTERANKPAFVRYAPILGLASKLDAGKLYDALSLIHTDNAQGVDGIDYSVFAQYVQSMKKQCEIERDEWPSIRSDISELARADVLLCVRTGILDSTGFPALCRIALTSHHFITETSLLRRRRCYAWSDVKSIEKVSASFLRGDSKFLMKFVVDGRIEERTLDAPGLGNELVLQRQRTYAYISDLITAHRLATKYQQQHALSALDTSEAARQQNQRTSIICNAIVHETSMTIKRMVALEAVKSETAAAGQKPIHAESLLLDPFVHGSEADENAYVQSIVDVVSKSDELRKNKDAGSWLGVLPVKGSVVELDIDPELSVNTQYNKLVQKDVPAEEAFSVARTSANVKLTRQLVEPVLIGVNLLCGLRDWHQPYVSGTVLAGCLTLAYQDACSYIPAIIVLCNILIILALKLYPELMPIKLLQPASVSGATNSPQPLSPVAASRVDSGATLVNSAVDSDDALESGVSAAPAGLLATYNKHKEGLLEKFKQYKSTALAGYAGMHTTDNNNGYVVYQWCAAN